MIKRHPRLVTLLGIVAMLSAFVVPAALAAPEKDPNSNACIKGNNPHCPPSTSTSTTTRTTTNTTTRTTTRTTPPTGTETITDTDTTTVTDTDTSTSPDNAPPGCEKKGLTEPPCGKGKSATTAASAGIPVGIVFLLLGGGVMGYLWMHRRRTLKLDA